MKKLILFISISIYSLTSFSQMIIGQPDLDVNNPIDCSANSGSNPNFYDTGFNTGNYSANEDETMTICPDNSTSAQKLSFTAGINTGLLFGIDASDTIFIYDGPNTSSPLLGAHNSDTDPAGFNHVTSFANNPTGCLTIQFKSDGATEGIGWDASIACIQLPQPIEMHMAGYVNGVDIINPVDTGYADVCLGDSILFVAQPNYIHSLETSGLGYSQNRNNVIFEWEFSDGSMATGDSVWFVPPARQGYIVDLKITDQFPQSQSMRSKVRVSTIPSFSGVLVTRDSICLNDTTVIVGAVTSTDTSGVAPTISSFQLGGTVAGLVYLPDGSGVSRNDTLNIAGFLPGATVTNITDIEQLCLNMEHSFLGDLEMQLTCPNGTSITIFNSNTGGIIPGGFGGGGTYLGHPIDGTLGSPGDGEEYCWSSSLANFGDFPTEFAANNFIALTTPTSPSAGNSMNWNGIYLPEESFTNLNGCPLNGDWSITVRDNLSIDDGYIFEWSILFDPLLNPNNETYLPSIVSGNWVPGSSASIVNTATLNVDTFAIVTSSAAGLLDYTFEVTDNFGCVYDTVAQVQFLGLPTIPSDASICDTAYNITGVNNALSGGVWSYNGPGTINFIPDNTATNPIVTTGTNGVYTFTFTDTQCALSDSFEINFIAHPVVQEDTMICSVEYGVIGTSSFNGGTWSYTGPGTATFSPSDTVENPVINVDIPGEYTFTFIDNQCALTDSFNVHFIPRPTIPSDLNNCDSEYQIAGATSFDGGTWSATGPGVTTFSPNDTTLNPLINVTERGRYTFTFTDKQCAIDTSFEYHFPFLVWATLDDAEFCVGDTTSLNATSPYPEATYLWSNGETTPTIIVGETGTYEVTVNGLCNSATDTSNINAIICKIDAHNVITPNGDGKNDFLMFDGIEHFPGSTLEVFNRWGKRIYKSENYNNDWSPTDVSAGTYFYVFNPGGKLEAETIPVSFTIFK